MNAYENATQRYRAALAELKFRADEKVPSVYCPATGKLVWPNAESPDSVNDPESRLSNLETVLFAFDHESGEFVYQSTAVRRAIERVRARSADLSNKSDFDVIVEDTPDFGGGFLVLDIEERAPRGHQACLTIGFDLAASGS